MLDELSPCRLAARPPTEHTSHDNPVEASGTTLSKTRRGGKVVTGSNLMGTPSCSCGTGAQSAHISGCMHRSRLLLSASLSCSTLPCCCAGLCCGKTLAHRLVLLPVLPLAATAAVAGHAAGSTYAAAATDKLQLQWTSQLLAGRIVAGTGESHVAEGNTQGLQRSQLLPSQ